MSHSKRKMVSQAAILIFSFFGTMAQVSAADRLTVAIPHKGLWDTTVIVSMGQQQHIFARHGLDLSFTYTSGGGATIQSITTGAAQIGIGVGILGVYSAAAHNAPVRIVSAEFTGASDIFWFAKASSNIKSVADLDGKAMSFSRPGASSEIVARAIAAGAGVKPDFVSSGELTATRTQVMTGQIAAGWSVPPFNLDLVHEGKARIIGSGSNNPQLKHTTTRVTITNSRYVKKHPTVVKRFMQAYQQSLDWVYSHQKKSETYYAKLNDVSMAIAKQSFSNYPKSVLQLSKVRGLGMSMKLAVQYKRLDKQLSNAQINKLIQIPSVIKK